VRLSQGLVHMGKGLLSLSPYHTDRQLCSGEATREGEGGARACGKACVAVQGGGSQQPPAVYVYVCVCVPKRLPTRVSVGVALAGVLTVMFACLDLKATLGGRRGLRNTKRVELLGRTSDSCGVG
jgi:hypothetical protein